MVTTVARRCARLIVLSTLVLVAALPALASAASRPGAVDPNASPRVARALAERYAPLLYLSLTEAWGPMRVPQFLANADLVWVRPGRDLLLARDGAVRAARLGARCVHAPGGCYRHGQVRASDASRPLSRDDSGFALDLDNAFYDGSAGRVPLYDDVRVGRHGIAITYWIFYGYDQPVLSLDPKVPPDQVAAFSKGLAHEGDWERVVVALSLGLKPVGVRYHQHDTSRFVPWKRVPLTAGSHPIAYVAKGTHASYASAGETRLCLAPGACLLDQRDQGRAIESWKDGLIPVRSRPWYGFGGAWGRAGELSATTGPLGPSRYKR